MPDRRLHILQVEDSESDAELILRALQKAGFEVHSERVEDAASMRAALMARQWDAIISDYKMPQFDAPGALAVLKESQLDIPFIVVSGTIGEDRAVEMMKTGVQDYLMKSHLDRLAPAVVREINEARQRQEHLRSQQALVESEARFRALFRSDVVGIFVASRERVVDANPYFLNVIGYTEDDLGSGGITFAAIAPPRDGRDISAENVRAMLETGSRAAHEREFLRKDGTWITVLSGGVRIRPEPSPEFLGFVVDLSDRKRLEQQFLDAQKLEGLGRMAGGVAHDFNNLLTVISGYANMLIEDLGRRDNMRESIEGIAEAAARAATLTRQLLAFSRHQISQPRFIVLNEVIAGFKKILERLIGEDIRMELSLAADPGVIHADPGQIEQVIMNLAVNARDAMPGVGTIYISTGNMLVDGKSSAEHLGLEPGPYVTVTVRDTGGGIPPAAMEHIFEPFFTTKEMGKGTGLGLATVYGIVRQSGGTIWVSSDPGHGATFKLAFPERQSTPDRAPVCAAPAVHSAGTETILVVEDDKAIRHFVRKILESQCYTVIEAINGKQALEIARATEDQIHLVLTDAIMPEMGGEDLSEHFSGVRPGVPFVCMSGYTDRAWRRENWAAAFIAKPFSATGLLAVIRKVLDARAT